MMSTINATTTEPIPGATSSSGQVPGEIRHAVLVRAAPEQVYDAFTTAAGLDRWFTTGAESDPRPGGEMTWRWHEWGPDKLSGAFTVPVIEAVRPSRFVFQWAGEGDDTPEDPSHGHARRTTVEVDFTPVPEGVVVRLRDHGYRDTPAGRRANIDCAVGWGEALALLKMNVEHGVSY